MITTATTAPPASKKRARILRLLASFGVELPPQTKLADEILNRRLMRAINAAQSIRSTIPSIPFIPSLLPKCERDRSGGSAFIIATVEPSHDAARPFYDVQQTIITIWSNWTLGYECSIVADVDAEDPVVNIRVLDVHKLDDRNQTPIILLIYRYLEGSDRVESINWMKSVPTRGRSGIYCMKATQSGCKLLIKLLAMNSKLLSDDYTPKKIEMENDFRPSFLLPFRPLLLEDLDKLNMDDGCSLCGEPFSGRCSRCQSVMYCGRGCQRVDWPNHKQTCRSLQGGQWQTVKFNGLHPATAFMFMNKSNQFDDIDGIDELGRTRTWPAAKAQAPPNIHGNKLFLVKLQIATDGNTCSQIMICDRQHSFDGFIWRDDHPSAFDQLLSKPGRPIRDGFMRSEMYRWAKRIGDQEFSICMDSEPQQDIEW